MTNNQEGKYEDKQSQADEWADRRVSVEEEKGGGVEKEKQGVNRK